MSYKRVRQNYIDGLWSKAQVLRAYQVGIITKEEYLEIIELPRTGDK